MNLPLVSVIVATYRRTDALKEAIRSVLSQTYENYELIVVDDNDDADWNGKVSAIVNDVVDGSEIFVQVICNHPNQGSAKTRNIGINAAHGEYICFLDDDDVFLPDRISNQIKDMLEVNADYGITDLNLYNEDDSINEIRKRSYLCGEKKDELLLCHLKYHMTGTDTLMFKRNYINSFGGFDPIDSGDEYYLMMKAIKTNGKIVYSPICDVKAYVHVGEGGLSSGNGKIEGENRLYKFKKTFFDKLKLVDRRYIRMRHYAVLAFAYLRMHKFIGFGLYGTLSFATAPRQCFGLLRDRRKA